MKLSNPSPLWERLLGWYDVHGRTLRWRAKGQKGDPYRVWVSEIMLQQTTVATVGPYFEAFMARWPTLASLASAALDEVLHGWQGLGYYTRARSLHRCAQVLMTQWQGRFPETEKDLLSLPGIGPYTAAAIGTICFEKPWAAVDGNITRVLARHEGLAVAGKALATAVKARAQALLPPERLGDYTQGLMDLGALICTPRKPGCLLCPLGETCVAFNQGTPDAFPLKVPRPPLPVKCGDAFWIQDPQGYFFFQKETTQRLLAGLMRPPLSPFEAAFSEAPLFPLQGDWSSIGNGLTRHTFTHFKLQLRSWMLTVEHRPHLEGHWVHPEAFPQQAFSTLVQKLLGQVDWGQGVSTL